MLASCSFGQSKIVVLAEEDDSKVVMSKKEIHLNLINHLFLKKMVFIKAVVFTVMFQQMRKN